MPAACAFWPSAKPRVESLAEEIGGDVLFRGQAQHFPKIESTLHRRFRSKLGRKISARLLLEKLEHFAVKHFGSELAQYKRDTGEIESRRGSCDPGKFSEDSVSAISAAVAHELKLPLMTVVKHSAG